MLATEAYESMLLQQGFKPEAGFFRHPNRWSFPHPATDEFVLEAYVKHVVPDASLAALSVQTLLHGRPVSRPGWDDPNAHHIQLDLESVNDAALTNRILDGVVETFMALPATS